MILKWIRKRNRQIDKDILFKAIDRQNADLRRADTAKYLHIISDSNWRWLEEYRDDPDLKELLGRIHSYQLPGCLI